MLTVGDLMTRHVEFVSPDATAMEAAALLGELDVSALPVGTPDALLGIVTDRDLLYRVLAEGLDPRGTRVAEVATKLVFTCRPEDPIAVAMDLMAAHNVRRLPVVATERVVGWLTLSDLARRLLVESTIVQGGLNQLAATLAPERSGVAPEGSRESP